MLAITNSNVHTRISISARTRINVAHRYRLQLKDMRFAKLRHSTDIHEVTQIIELLNTVCSFSVRLL